MFGANHFGAGYFADGYANTAGPGATVTGVTFGISLTFPAGDATVYGVTLNLALAMPAGTATGSAVVAGAVFGVAFAFPAGGGPVGATVVGVTFGLTLAVPNGAATASGSNTGGGVFASSKQIVTYLFTDNYGNRIDQLPVKDVSFSLVLNGSGQFSGTLNVGDPRVQALAWINATAPNLAQVWVDIDGTLVYGGRVTNRKYDRNTGTVALQALDHMSYLQQRLQAGDYSTNWATTPTGAAQIAHQIIADALAVSGSLGISLSTPAATPAQYRITLTAPRQQRMTIDALCNMMAGLGWQVGFDYATDVAYIGGVPTSTITLSYPRRGRIAGTTGLMLDASQSIALTYAEDGTQQADSVAQTAVGGGGVSTVGTYEPAISVDKYPLLEKLAMHTSFTAAKTPASVLAAFAADDLALGAYPVVAPQITMPMFSPPTIGEWIVGDDVRVTIPKTAGAGPAIDPRFPNGLDTFFRITRADVTIPNEGVSTTAFTFAMPPSSNPQRPPQ